jgi:hypothetical protein
MNWIREPFIQIALPIMVTLILAMLVQNKRFDDLTKRMEDRFTAMEKRIDVIIRRLERIDLVSIPGGWVQPSPHRALTIAEIAGIVQDYRRAAERAMEVGFEGWRFMGRTVTSSINSFRTEATNETTSMAAPSRTGHGFFLKSCRLRFPPAVRTGFRCVWRPAVHGTECPTAIRPHCSRTWPNI